MNQNHTALFIDSLICKVRLGCTEQERATAQEVRFFLELEFQKEPLACTTDDLNDTICYDELSKQIVRASCDREFQTVEHLTKLCFDKLRESLPASVRLVLETHKVNPPVENLTGGVRFRITG